MTISLTLVSIRDSENGRQRQPRVSRAVASSSETFKSVQTVKYVINNELKLIRVFTNHAYISS